MKLQMILCCGLILVCENIAVNNCPKKCKDFTGPLNPQNPTIIFRRSEGGLGNQLNGYAMMLQLKRKSGYDAYITKDSYQIIRKLFTRESVELMVLEDTFCNVDIMSFEVSTLGLFKKPKYVGSSDFANFWKAEMILN